MTTPTANAYDQIPYISHPFAQTHPNVVGALAKLFGITPPPIHGCRVLELGCASGGNLIPMAMTMPDSTFLGIDLSERQIGQGKSLVSDLGLTNIELQHADLASDDVVKGQFDYIIAHGVFSWVPRHVQDRLLDICRDNLAPNGIAFVSYNTNPGWRMRSMIRDAMRYHAAQFAEPELQVRQARALIDFLAQNVPTENSPYGMLLKQELEDMRKRGDWYLAHDHLEGVNDPVYFHEFIERTAAHGLQYLADADFKTMSARNYPPKVAETLRVIAPDLVRMEQYTDFILNRTFRQSLLVHQAHRLQRKLDYRNAAGFCFQSRAVPVGTVTDITTSKVEKFALPGGATLGTPNPITKAAMLILHERWPLGMYFEDLCLAARARLDNASVVSATPPLQADDARILGADLIECFAAGIVEILLEPWPVGTLAGAAPRVSRLVRYQAERGHEVTNLRHESLGIDEFNRQLIGLLDGTRSRDELVDAMVDKVNTKILAIQREGKTVTDAAEVRALITKAVDENVAQLARVGLLDR
ncbi:MAG: methyltransferase regulatory domain-containing protein [Burkholderiales bacterium]